MKLIIDIHEEQYEFIKQGMSIDKVVQFPALMEAICEHIACGIPLNDVKTKIETNLSRDMFDKWGNETRLHKELMEILDNIGKVESENKE